MRFGSRWSSPLSMVTICEKWAHIIVVEAHAAGSATTPLVGPEGPEVPKRANSPWSPSPPPCCRCDSPRGPGCGSGGGSSPREDSCPASS
eukprot:1293910-Prymnesium_polylepis.1